MNKISKFTFVLTLTFANIAFAVTDTSQNNGPLQQIPFIRQFTSLPVVSNHIKVIEKNREGISKINNITNQLSEEQKVLTEEQKVLNENIKKVRKEFSPKIVENSAKIKELDKGVYKLFSMQNDTVSSVRENLEVVNTVANNLEKTDNNFKGYKRNINILLCGVVMYGLYKSYRYFYPNNKKVTTNS